MKASSPEPKHMQSKPTTAGSGLRRWGILLLVLFFLTSAVGGSLALESSYLLITLASHIGLALVTLAVAAYATSTASREYRTLPRASAGLVTLSALGGTIAGTVFLLYGQNSSALDVMEGFALVGILTAIVMIVSGGPSGRKAGPGESPVTANTG
jgi:hypothetical protein